MIPQYGAVLKEGGGRWWWFDLSGQVSCHTYLSRLLNLCLSACSIVAFKWFFLKNASIGILIFEIELLGIGTNAKRETSASRFVFLKNGFVNLCDLHLPR